MIGKVWHKSSYEKETRSFFVIQYIEYLHSYLTRGRRDSFDIFLARAANKLSKIRETYDSVLNSVSSFSRVLFASQYSVPVYLQVVHPIAV